MLSGLSTRGEVVIDNGAVTAIVNNNRSLLPAGVKRVVGSFERGDIVSILDSGSAQIAAGIINYGSADLAKISGHHSDRIGDILGHEYGDEAVHRSNMVIM